ncbi:hypothetical protein BCE75_101384 [Isoptericola sp. CG 20/1183]|uniref:Uncharacterized protein n=1 Tax=Isoptericola halotolerans TaxID=300560 RepID=A0ABX5EK25_9MICO|nr:MULTISPECIES: hypothetical protein [Isoptericola]PRZ08496.1 hypothetical protein BCL65_10238 [Isoptericola halotolerans]PRZ11057.1 hypothetical protein BCE75_101384 [Isoptericola sp. CG 20/1183]
MGERLQLDLEAVRDTSARLRSIGRSLADAESAADDLAAMIPHRGLAGAVATFATTTISRNSSEAALTTR